MNYKNDLNAFKNKCRRNFALFGSVVYCCNGMEWTGGSGRRLKGAVLAKTDFLLGSGCGTVGRAVASDARGPGFESIHFY